MTMKKIIDSGHTHVDPLYIIFEKHLYQIASPETDRAEFISAIVQDYLTFLRKRKVLIPKPLEASIIEELGAQVNTMLVKKIYGFVSINEFVHRAPLTAKKRSKSRYRALGKARAVPKKPKRDKKMSLG